MKKKIRHFFSAIPEYFKMIFFSAAENHIIITHKGQKKFYSYAQLKRHQKKVRKSFALAFLVLVFLLIGIVIGPTILPQKSKSEIYIPNGRGDILIGNVSKNQATIIFKTLDGANNDKPLATKAYVEIYQDQFYNKLMKQTDVDDYAVKHIIPIDNLVEGNTYYMRIIASDLADFSNAKTISSWGNGNDPINVYTTGELASSCSQNPAVPVEIGSNTTGKNETVSASTVKPSENILNNQNAGSTTTEQNSSLKISNVQSENNLQPGDKIQTIISWDTNIPATAVLMYGEESGGNKNEIANDKKQTRHAVTLTTLKTDTIYYFEVKSEDDEGNVVTSKEYSLHTPKPEEKILEKIMNNFKALIYR